MPHVLKINPTEGKKEKEYKATGSGSITVRGEGRSGRKGEEEGRGS